MIDLIIVLAFIAYSVSAGFRAFARSTGDQAVFPNNVWAILPAMGGKKVLARRIRVSFQPKMPTSMGRRLTTHKDQLLR